ncbi:hypothetical protein TCE0_016f03189 [Talaromyces pinophilus]|uniref:Uncharacterized protein n=1 Tax=Talaromyces pinophilus TaxID=128442 RepID=A0A0B8N0N7_TALPI|nr:hypothetical protein TCE0_016f03189 [Talaromyces pinophilus]
MSKLTPQELLAELEAFSSGSSSLPETDPQLVSKLSHAARKFTLFLEKPADVVARVFLSQPVELATIRIASRLQLFNILKTSNQPMSIRELAIATNADEVLLARVLRSSAAFGIISEVGDDEYAFKPSFELFANPVFAEGLDHCAAFLGPSYNALPGFLSSIGFANPTDPTNSAVQCAFNAKGLGLLDILMARPDNARGFGTLMNTWGEGNSLIQDMYPIRESLVVGFDPESVMFVDVGGGYGQKAIALKRAIPDLPGQVIVQDLPGTIDNAPKAAGIEYQAHDFFTEQPVKGARAYYIRQCLHNWPKERCVTILSNLAAAMKQGYSKLFVHELIVPRRRAGTWMVTQDFNMMTLCGTQERTVEQWRELLSEAGLKVAGVYHPEDGVSEGVIEAGL